MNIAIILAFVAFLAWGLWGLATEPATTQFTAGQTYLLVSVLNLIGATVYVLSKDSISLIPEYSSGIKFVVLAGLFATIGSIAFYEAIERGTNTGVVVTIASLYFIVTAVGGWLLLNEPMSLREWGGVIIAAVGLALLAY